MNRPTTQKNCALCRTSSSLINSHVVPHWLWLLLKDDGKYFQVSTGSIEFGQSEGKEPLMCSNCDNSFSALEKRVSLLVRKWIEHPFPNEKLTIGLPTYVQFPYTDAKLFALLTVWRMGLSSLPDYEAIRLPPDAMEDIRQRLISSDAGPWFQYPVRVVLEQTGFLKGLMRAPEIVEHGGIVVVRWFVAGAWLWFYLPLSGLAPFGQGLQDIPPQYAPGFLREDGRLHLVHQPLSTDSKTANLVVGDQQVEVLQQFLRKKRISH